MATTKAVSLPDRAWALIERYGIEQGLSADDALTRLVHEGFAKHLANTASASVIRTPLGVIELTTPPASS